MKRRLFVATPLLLAGSLAAERWRPLLGGHDADEHDASERRAPRPLVRVAATAFGTTISLSALDDGAEHDGERTRAALRCAMQEVQRVDALLSLFRPDSQLSILNRTGALEGAHPHLLRNLDFALRLGTLTRGAFDPTIQPLWELFAQARMQGALPGRAAIAHARRLVDYRAVRIDGDRVRLDRPGAKLTLNSLAQGYAVDVVLDILRARGVHAALIDTGEIGNLGERDALHPWMVGVQHPRDRQGLIARIGMDGRVLSTSGDYATTFSSDFRYHHIFDPATGVSPPQYSSTIVLAPSGLVADGISTALMVLDHAAGSRLLRSFPGSDALWIDKQSQLAYTPGVPFAGALAPG